VGDELTHIAGEALDGAGPERIPQLLRGRRGALALAVRRGADSLQLSADSPGARPPPAQPHPAPAGARGRGAKLFVHAQRGLLQTGHSPSVR